MAGVVRNPDVADPVDSRVRPGVKHRVIKDAICLLYTSASSGIGRAIAVAFAREGARVAITYRSNKGAAEETVTHIDGAGGHGFAVPMDLTEPSGIDNACLLYTSRCV